MALLTTISDTNLVISEGAVTKYSAEPEMYGSGVNTMVAAWKLTRDFSISFSYIGLTRQAAESAAATLRSDYTRKYFDWQVEVSDGESADKPNVIIIPQYKRECSSSVSARPTAGDAWEVECQISEQDVIYSETEPLNETDYANLFAAASARPFPGSTPTIAVESAVFDESSEIVKVDYVQSGITNFDTSKISVDVWSDTQSAWVNTPCTNRTNSSFMFSTTAWDKFRINYNQSQYISREFMPEYIKSPDCEITSAILTIAYNSQFNTSYYELTVTATCDEPMQQGDWRIRVTCNGNSSITSNAYPQNLGSKTYRMKITSLDGFIAIDPQHLDDIEVDLLFGAGNRRFTTEAFPVTPVAYIYVTQCDDESTGTLSFWFSSDLDQTDLNNATATVGSTTCPHISLTQISAQNHTWKMVVNTAEVPGNFGNFTGSAYLHVTPRNAQKEISSNTSFVDIQTQEAYPITLNSVQAYNYDNTWSYAQLKSTTTAPDSAQLRFGGYWTANSLLEKHYLRVIYARSGNIIAIADKFNDTTQVSSVSYCLTSFTTTSNAVNATSGDGISINVDAAYIQSTTRLKVLGNFDNSTFSLGAYDDLDPRDWKLKSTPQGGGNSIISGECTGITEIQTDELQFDFKDVNYGEHDTIHLIFCPHDQTGTSIKWESGVGVEPTEE